MLLNPQQKKLNSCPTIEPIQIVCKLFLLRRKSKVVELWWCVVDLSNRDGVHHVVLYNVVFIGRLDDGQQRRDADVPSRWIQSLASGPSPADSSSGQLLPNAPPARGKNLIIIPTHVK